MSLIPYKVSSTARYLTFLTRLIGPPFMFTTYGTWIRLVCLL